MTLEGDIRLDLTVDSSSRGSDVNIGGVNIPSFGQRKVTTRLRLRDGESNLLAGLFQENEQTGVTGFPGAIHVPFLKQLFSGNTGQIDQTDIVMLLTPHIVRTHEITESDLKPIYIGSQQNLGVGGPPPLIAPMPEAPPAGASASAPAGGRLPTPAAPARGPNLLRGPGGTIVAAPPGSSPVPGTVLVPAPAPPTGRPPRRSRRRSRRQPGADSGRRRRPPQPRAAAPAAPAAVPTASPGIGSAQVLISPPGPTFRVGGGPYTVPLSITDATRISTVTLTLVYDPTKLRVRNGAGGQLHARGRRERRVHAAGERQPHRHHAGARRRRDRRVRHRACSRPCSSTPSRPAAR